MARKEDSFGARIVPCRRKGLSIDDLAGKPDTLQISSNRWKRGR